MGHARYLAYVLRHKWWVLVYGLHFGVPLWRLIVHDASKFSAAEWGPYVRKFYGGSSPRDATGAYDQNAQGDEFKAAWRHHWTSNPHHWEFWAHMQHPLLTMPVPLDDPWEMPETYVREMVADWHGAGRAQGKGDDVSAFYRANGPRMRLHPDTRALVERLLLLIGVRPMDLDQGRAPADPIEGGTA